MSVARAGVASPQGDRSLHVIIVSYCRFDLLTQCLDSIPGAVGQLRVSVTVIDNASPDGTADRVAARYPELRLVRNRQNVGFAAAVNQGLALSDTDFILLLNPDTVLSPGALSKCVDELQRRPGAAVLSCRLVRSDGTLDHACKRSFPTPAAAAAYFIRGTRLRRVVRTTATYTADDIGEFETASVDAVSGAFMLVRRAAVDDIGPMDASFWMYGEDLDWCFRFKQAGWQVVYWPAISVVHLKGGSAGQHRSLRTNIAFHRSMWIFYRKHQARRYGAVMSTTVACGIGLRCAVSVVQSAVARRRPGGTRGR